MSLTKLRVVFAVGVSVLALACGEEEGRKSTSAVDGGDGDGAAAGGSGATGGQPSAGTGGEGALGGTGGVGGVGGTGGTTDLNFLVTTTALEGALVSEMGSSDDVLVSLAREPSADVVLPVVSSDESEGLVSPDQLVFTPLNWNAPQSVTLTGVDDDAVDGNIAFQILLGPATSDDSSFDGQSAVPVAATTIDDETPGVTVFPTSNLQTTEAGGTAELQVVLNAQPMADVSIDLSSSDDTEGTVEPSQLTFTADNWAAPQMVTVRGVDDDQVDGDVDYSVVTSVTSSTDSAYDGLDVADATVTNIDDESAGFTVTPTMGLQTTEAGGQDSFTVVLNAAPSADVSVPVASNDLGEGSASPAMLTFTPANWNAPQTVTVTGLDDNLADGNQPYSVELGAASSSDSEYDGLDPVDVQVSNLDDETAGVQVNPTAGLMTTEGGGSAIFTLVLSSQPSADVTIPLSSSNTAEGTVSPSSVTFTASNWDAPQQATVTGVDDAVADGNQPYSVLTGAATSGDANYDGFDAANVAVTNTDNDSPGITVNPMTGVVTTEGGGQDTFEIVLNSEPTAVVTIALSSSAPGEVAVAPASVTFTALNWNAPQVVTLTGQDDSVADGNQPFTILTAAASSSDSSYDGRPVPDVTGSNTDNDSAGITVTPTSGLTTSEAGGQDTFEIVLNSEPTADVTIALSSSANDEGTVSPASVTFTALNWNSPQTVTVTGEDDSVADGNQPFTVVTGDAVSGDASYSGFVIPDVSVTNTDNDSAGITVTPTSGLITSEGGGQDTFEIVLNSEPTADVTIALSSSNTNEGTVGPASVTFTALNWNAPRTVTITGADDAVADGNQPYTIVTGDASSADSSYSGFVVPDVAVSNTDNDSAGITVTPTSGLVTTEGGGQDSFDVVLNSEPTGDVTITFASSDSSEGTVAPASVTFTSLNWNAPVTITVTGEDDAVADGAQPFTVVRGGAAWGKRVDLGRGRTIVAVSNTDNDSAGITVTPTNGLTTTEGGGQASFDVVLNSQPTSNVTISVASSDVGEGTVSTSQLTFTTANWNAPQTVTVSGEDDAIADGPQPFTVVLGAAASSDPGYNGQNVADVSVTNTDNDSAGITVTPTSGLTTTEGGGAATFDVVLNSEPTANVVITVSSSNPAEGTVLPTTLTFTSVNWAAPQTVTVTGQDDAVADGNQPFTIITSDASSGDSGYDGFTVADVSVTNTDNDSAGITVTPTSGLVTTEAGGQDSFDIVLNSEPTANVTITLASNATGEGTVAPASVTFTPLNWNAPRTITVTGEDDAVADGSQPYTIVTSDASSSDPGYSGRVVPNVSVTNTDNDSAGITVTPTSGLTTTEGGGQASFDVSLNSEPTANVTIAVASSNTNEGSVSTALLTFTPVNWNAPQTVTITGENDAVADGPQPYTVVLGNATSADPGYSGMNVPDVSVTNTDNDSAGITVTPTAGLMTNEGGGQAFFDVVLNSQPTADVEIAVVSSDPTEGTVSTALLTFTSVNWSAPQQVTISGEDDAVADGNQIFNIVLGPAVSSDPGYSGRTVPSVECANTDNDTAGVTVLPTSGLITTEGGGFGSFDVRLNSEPTADVTISLASNRPTEAVPDQASLTFTPLNWSSPQTVVVDGQDDFVADGNQPFTIITGDASSSDANYSGFVVADVTGTNNDNDSAGVSVTPTSGLTTTEAPGGTATFDVVLLSEPTANVTISVTSSQPGEGQPDTGTLTFTPGNWNGVQTVTVTGQDDAVADGNQPYSIILGNASSTDPGYDNFNVPDVSLTNTDNDSAGITVTPTSGLTTTEAGGTASFDIVLTSQPTANVRINIASSDTGEGTPSVAQVTFNSGNWDTPRTVTITGQNDAVADGNQPYTIVLSNAISGDPGYSGRNVPDVSVTNTDNDSAGITVNPTSGLTTTEAGGTDTFSIVLNSQPTADVTINLSSSDTGEGTVSPPSITFTSGNWDTARTVTVTGVDDPTFDGNQAYTIITSNASSSDPGYSGRAVANVGVTNEDNDPKTVTVSPTSVSVSENVGSTDTFTVVLDQLPTSDVTIALSSSDTSEGTVSPSSLTFTTSNWNNPRTVTVSGVNDDIDDDLQNFTIVTGAVVSSDPAYNGVNPADVSASCADNDSAGIVVNPTSGLVTSEAGASDTFTISLLSEPVADVVIPLTSLDPGEGSVPAQVTFTAGNWDTPQNVTVSGVNDVIFDRDQTYTVAVQAATSGDSKYNGTNPPDVQALNLDDDQPTFLVAQAGVNTGEATSAGDVTLDISLNDAPTADVQLTFSSTNTAEGTVSPGAITFTSGNFSTPQTVTISGVDDDVDDGDIAYTVQINPSTSTDTPFDGIDLADVSLTNVDDDTANIIVSPVSGLTTTEAGGSAQFTIRLASRPTADVSVGVSSLDTSEGTVSPGAVSWTPATWTAVRTVTVNGRDDTLIDGNVSYTVRTDPPTTSDPLYAAINPADVSCLNIDDERNTSRASLDNPEQQLSCASGRPSISAEGKIVAFDTCADLPNTGDNNRDHDVFLRDVDGASTLLVSVHSSGSQGDGPSDSPSISEDGRVVAFRSSANNLVDDDSNDVSDIFVHYPDTGQTIRVSVNSAAQEANGPSSHPRISPDGNFVIFYSVATNLVSSDTNKTGDIFMHNIETKETTRVSVSTGPNQLENGALPVADVSRDGKFVAFATFSSDAHPADIDNFADVFLYDTGARVTEPVSWEEAGSRTASGDSFEPTIDDEGRLVAFMSTAADNISGDGNDVQDVFVRDIEGFKTTRASVKDGGGENALPSGEGEISPDGAFVVYATRGDLSGDDTNGLEDIYRTDWGSRITLRVNLTQNSMQTTQGKSADPVCSQDGKFIAFTSESPELVPNDTNDVVDVFRTEETN